LGENSGIETVQFCGASRFFEMTDTELSKDITEEGCTRFTAHTVGNAADNPDHALDLTQLQKNRLITALYTDVSSFTVVFAATPGHHGRNIIFSTVGPLCGKYFFLAWRSHVLNLSQILSCPTFFYMRPSNSFPSSNTFPYA